MTEAELARLEDGLKLSLPKRYVELFRRLQVEAPYSQLREGPRPFWTGIRELLQFNLNVRSSPRGWCEDPVPMQTQWPDHLFICGYEHYGSILYLFDVREDNPRLLEITRERRLGLCQRAPDLESLYAYALDLYRQQFAKLKKKKRARYDWMLAQLNSPSPPRRAEHQEKTANSKLVKEFTALLAGLGFDVAAPKRKHSIQKLTADLALEMPTDLISLYSACDGGECRNLNLRIVPLQEASDLAVTLQGIYPTMGYFPFVKNINGEYSFLITTGPLTGYVVMVHHDGPHEFKARSLRGFLETLAKNRNSQNWRLEDCDYSGGRPPEHVPFELAAQARTSGDIEAAKALLQLAEQRVHAEDGADEYAHLFELALQLLPDEQSLEMVPLLQHRDHEVRHLAERRLAPIETTEVIAARKAAADEFQAFMVQGVEVLRENGLDAHIVNATDIRIDPGPVWLNVPVFFNRRHESDVWEYLVDRATFFVSLEKKELK
jgi:hypothetical protein